MAFRKKELNESTSEDEFYFADALWEWTGFILTLTAVLLGCMLLTSKTQQWPSFKEDYAFNTVSEGEVTVYHDLLKRVVSLFDEHDITYWAVGGTHLGATRCQPPGLIRWDDDMELGVYADDARKILKALKDVPEILRRGDLTTQGRLTLALQDRTDEVRNAYALRIYGFTWIERNQFYQIYQEKTGYFSKRRLKFRRAELEGLHSCPFWDLSLYCPGQDHDESVHILKRTFGQDVMDVGVTTRSGFLNNQIKRINLARDDINQHGALWPALDKSLLRKLVLRQ